MVNIVKICTQCKQEKKQFEFYKRRTRPNPSICKQCERKYNKSEAGKRRKAKYYKKYREKEYVKVARRERERIYFKEKRGNLTDNYIKRSIIKNTSLGLRDVPQGIIEVYRLYLILKRLKKSTK